MEAPFGMPVTSLLYLAIFTAQQKSINRKTHLSLKKKKERFICTLQYGGHLCYLDTGIGIRILDTVIRGARKQKRTYLVAD